MRGILNGRSAKIAAVMVVIFVVSLIPILIVSFYNHPCADDYGYSVEIHHVIVSGGGFGAFLKKFLYKIYTTYFGWQGTYSAIALFTLQPGVGVTDEPYFLTTFIMLGALIGATLFLMETIFVKWLKMRCSHMLIIALTLLFVQIQNLPSIAEGFFWFNGSSYYTLFYAFELVLAALLLRICLEEKAGRRKGLTVLASILAFGIGGGNFSTSLFSVCALFIVLIIAMRKKTSWRKNLTIVFSVLLTGFAISVLAPGNAVRGQYTIQTEPVLAIMKAIHYGFLLLGHWTTLAEVAALIFISPLLYMAARKCTWSFRYPFLVMMLIFALFACQIAPPLYGVSNIGAGRQQNIYYYSMLLMWAFDIFYLSGWIARHGKGNAEIGHIKELIDRQFAPALLAIVFVFFAGRIALGPMRMTSVACTMALVDGSAMEYDEIITANIAAMESTEGKAYVRDMEDPPMIFMPMNLSEDHTFWGNSERARYYGCESVHLIQAE